jgi:uncharacterized protein
VGPLSNCGRFRGRGVWPEQSSVGSRRSTVQARADSLEVRPGKLYLVVEENGEVAMSFHWIGLLVLGLMAGVLAGLAGVGGGIIIVPALVFLFGFNQHLAQGTSLAVLIPPVGLLAMLQYYRKGDVDLKAAALIAGGLLLGSVFGAKVALGLPQGVLKKIFGGVLLLASMRYLLMK